MKKTIALILTLTMAAAALSGAVSATESASPASTFRVGGNRGDWSVSGSDYTRYVAPGAPNFGLYVLGNALDGEVTLSADLTVGNEYGFMFGITDVDGNNSIGETGDQYYLVDLRTDGSVGVEKNDMKWGDWAASSEVLAAKDETVKLTATYTKGADGVKIVVSANGTVVITYEDSDPFVGVAYGLASKSGAPMKNVSAPDLRNSAMSQELIANVEANNPRIAYKAGSAKHAEGTVTGRVLGTTSGTVEEALEHLFDDVNDKETSRFMIQYTNKLITITWETEEAAIASYLIIYGGPNVQKNNRSIASFVLYGSTTGEDGDWHEIANAGRVHHRQNDSVGGIHLDNDTAYDHYRIDMVKTEGDEIESLGIGLYVDPNQKTETPDPTTPDPTTPVNPDPTKPDPTKPEPTTPVKPEPAPTTGSASVVIAAVAVVALAGVVVATKKREQD